MPANLENSAVATGLEKVSFHSNPKEATQKLVKLNNELSKVARFKINIWKSVTFLYTNNEISEREYF